MSERIESDGCESCGMAATVRLDDGSLWCDACDEAARKWEDDAE